MSRTHLQQTKKQDKNNITTTMRKQTVQQFGKSMLYDQHNCSTIFPAKIAACGSFNIMTTQMNNSSRSCQVRLLKHQAENLEWKRKRQFPALLLKLRTRRRI
jgi:hypothetical protein